jgi:hypothetical protein
MIESKADAVGVGQPSVDSVSLKGRRGSTMAPPRGGGARGSTRGGPAAAACRRLRWSLMTLRPRVHRRERSTRDLSDERPSTDDRRGRAQAQHLERIVEALERPPGV